MADIGPGDVEPILGKRGLNAERVSYEELTQALKTSLNLVHQGYVALAPDIIVGGVSNLEALPARKGDHAASTQANNNDNEARPNSEVDTGIERNAKGSREGSRISESSQSMRRCPI